jgi:hypothetical protein
MYRKSTHEIKAANFPNIKKDIDIQIQKTFTTTPNRNDQKRTFMYHIVIKMPRVQNKEIILNTAKEKCQLTYKRQLIRITYDFLAETIKSKKAGNDIF